MCRFSARKGALEEALPEEVGRSCENCDRKEAKKVGDVDGEGELIVRVSVGTLIDCVYPCRDA